MCLNTQVWQRGHLACAKSASFKAGAIPSLGTENQYGG